MDTSHISLAALGFFAIEALAADYVAHFLKHVGHFVAHHIYRITLKYRVVRLRDCDIIEITDISAEDITPNEGKSLGQPNL